ncbi:MAG: proline--tRNA ligase [bacterium]|nr:proline--tRNA ligase [bacterium]
MLLSKLFTKTTKESASDSSSINADLLTRAGFVHKTMAGVYSYLPLGYRVLRKIEQVVREEMDTIGSEMFMPAISPIENWKKTGRDQSVSVLFSVSGANDASKKLNDSSYILNATHEDVITPIFQHFVSSYKDLPCAAYQIQSKFRNEARPKSGILRGREFRMKDLYSFHVSEEDQVHYLHAIAKPAYTRVFDRLGLGDRTVIALASGGEFTKEPSVEFQTKCDNGEDLIFYDSKSDMYYNKEIVPCKAPKWGDPNEEERPREDVVGEGIIGVEELAAFLKVDKQSTTKTLLYESDDGRFFAATVRGGYDVNEEKLCAVAGCDSIKLASVAKVKEVTGADVGYAGPIGLPKDVVVYWDDSTQGRKNFECGANKTNEHSININFGRDVDEPKEFYDIKVGRDGDINPSTGEPYEVCRASEVGNLFSLGTRFSEGFGFTFTDQDGKNKPVYMGSYGLGTSRVMGVIAEISHDEHGLIWPENIAPAQVHIVPIAKTTDDEAYTEAMKLYEGMQKKGIECLFDDRIDGSVGARLADADLIGVPKRIVVSPKTLEKGGVEVKIRSTGKEEILALDAVLGDKKK